MPGWGGTSCVGCGDGGAVDGGVCFDVSHVTIVSIQSDASVFVVVSASVLVSACHDSLSGSGYKAVVGLCVWYILAVCIRTAD